MIGIGLLLKTLWYFRILLNEMFFNAPRIVYLHMSAVMTFYSVVV